MRLVYRLMGFSRIPMGGGFAIEFWTSFGYFFGNKFLGSIAAV